MFFNYSKYIIVFFLIIILIPTFFISILQFKSSSNIIEKQKYFSMSNTEFCWPIPGYTRISSYYGKRISPTNGASSYHLGIDIPAPDKTSLISPVDATVTFIGFNGSGGYSIILRKYNLEFIYHHVSPNYIVTLGDLVYKGQIIGQVGPKNIYGIKNNPYKDANGNPTNGATTGPHLHFAIKKDGVAVNPLDYYI